jgi:hypothetical protein
LDLSGIAVGCSTPLLRCALKRANQDRSPTPSLPETEDDNPVRVRVIVGRSERVGLIFVLAAKMVPRNPPSWAIERLTVADRQAGLELSPIGLAARLEPTTGRSGVERRIQHPTCHQTILPTP